MRFRGPKSLGQIVGAVVVVMLAAGWLVFQADKSDLPENPSSSHVGAFTVADLPKEARETLALIDSGGPFPYRQDDMVFGNREHRLPAKPNGYYREFTVATPNSNDRGPRRLIRGSEGETYYTSDHYASFHLVERN
ncbi:MAG: ribonuclease domain-containing protein [Aeromicrobium sp.]